MDTCRPKQTDEASAPCAVGASEAVIVVDDWARPLPIAPGEVEAVENFFSVLLDEIFEEAGQRSRPSKGHKYLST